MRERMSNTITDCLLMMCQETDDDNLWQVYHDWASRPRGLSEHRVFQQRMEAACATLGKPQLKVTPTQVVDFNNFRLAGSGYFNIGNILLHSSITPGDGTSPHARSMLAADRVRGDAFNLGANPESGAVTPGDVIRLRNMRGYVPSTWSEAIVQIHCMHGLMGELLSVPNIDIAAYGRFLHKYDHVLTRLDGSRVRWNRYTAIGWGRPW
jgi:hypothetical protein